MKNKYKILTEIIELCLYLDVTACSTYRKFALECKIPSLAAEWDLRAKEEKSHILFWKQALILSKEKQLPLIFENPVEVKNKLKKIKHTLKRIFSTFNAYSDPSEELTIAFLLENYMLDPFFMMMFHAYSFINENIEDEYEKHLLTFINMSKRYHTKSDSLHVELFNETLHNLYVINRKL